MRLQRIALLVTSLIVVMSANGGLASFHEDVLKGVVDHSVLSAGRGTVAAKSCLSDRGIGFSYVLDDPCSDCLASCPPIGSPGHVLCVGQCRSGPCHG